MSRTVGGADADSLERSSSRRADSIRFGPKAYGVERAEVCLSTCAFSPHRHDTYAIGVTTAGVQTFGYRGSRCVCLPGQLHVLHPDEAHDGAAGTEDGFSYRILYIAPELIRGALAGRALPFVADPVQEPTPAVRPIASLLADIDDPISELSCAEIAVAVADCLLSLSGRRGRRRATIDLRGVGLVRDYLAANASGQSLAQVAAEVGFADQSHMTRQFKRTYGLTPARWMTLTAASSPERPATRGQRRHLHTLRPGTKKVEEC